MESKCAKEDAIDMIKEDIKDIKQDIKSIVKMQNTLNVKFTDKVARLEVKSGFWGAIGGTLPFVIGLIIYYSSKK